MDSFCFECKKFFQKQQPNHRLAAFAYDNIETRRKSDLCYNRIVLLQFLLGHLHRIVLECFKKNAPSYSKFMGSDMKNVAYTKEYLLQRQSYAWVYDQPPLDHHIFQLGNGKYTVECLEYCHKEFEESMLKCCYNASKATIKDQSQNTILSFKHDGVGFMLNWLWHSNGREYFLFKQELYGYSVMDIQSGEVVHYVPQKSFLGGETFIWTNVLYCPNNNLLVVDGCYWAAPYGNEFYDFSDPMKLPLPLYCTTEDIANDFGFHTANDILTTGFTEDGRCSIEGCVDADGLFEQKAVVDILGWAKKHKARAPRNDYFENHSDTLKKD